MAITYATLCSGVECAGLAADDLEWKQVFSAEIDPFACEVLRYRRPNVTNLGDMTLLADRIRTGGEPSPDVLIAGTPCQAFSIAGLQGSLDDDRGNLTLELVRVLTAIDNARLDAGKTSCCTLVWENVPGIFSTKDNAFGCFLAALVGSDKPIPAFGRTGKWPRAGMVIGPRRAAAWRVLDAQWFGVAQRRRRVFLVAGAGVGFDPSAVLFEPESVSRNPPPRPETRQDVTGTLSARASAGGGLGTDFECAGGLVAVPTGDFIAYGGNNTSGPIDVATARSAHKGPHGRLDFETETFLVADIAAYRTSPNCGAWDTGDRVDALTTGTDPTSHLIAFDTTQITSLSNYSKPKSGDPCHPLAATAHPPAIAFQSSQSGVRRLTPVECERLQGLPDNWTLIPVKQRKKLEADFLAYVLRHRPHLSAAAAEYLASDGPRYRAIGNGMAVPVMSWILRRLDPHLKEITP